MNRLHCLALAGAILSGSVSVIDIGADAGGGAVMRQIEADKRPRGIAADPAGIAIGPGGRQVYVSNGVDGSVTAIDPVRPAVSATIPVGQLPWGVVIR
jgi:YVTN family beta-propeller protein